MAGKLSGVGVRAWCTGMVMKEVQLNGLFKICGSEKNWSSENCMKSLKT